MRIATLAAKNLGQSADFMNRHKAIRILGWFLALLLIGCSRFEPQPPEFDARQAMEFLEHQVGEGPRIPGSAAHRRTGDWILESLKTFGWQTSEQTWVYRGVTLRNLAAVGGPAEGKHILLGAHYDTRPLADRDPAQAGGAVPGANDGASGVAVLLELARIFADVGGSCRLELVFFDGEDSGRIADWEWIVGSTYYAQRMPKLPQAVIIVDMVGDADLRLPIERSSNPALAGAIWQTAAELGHPAFTTELGVQIIDDHTPFLALGVPAVDIIDFEYPSWHKLEDTLDKVSADSLAQVGETLRAWLLANCH